MRNAYRVVSEQKNGEIALTADQCYSCNKPIIERKSLERHLNSCSHMPDIIYKFENQKYINIFHNVKLMGDLPFSTYFAFETTSGKRVYHFDEDASLYPVSYAFVVAFHPSLNTDKIFVVRSFNHTFEQLNDVGYLSSEMFPYCDPVTVQQLRDWNQENVFVRPKVRHWFAKVIAHRKTL